MENIRQGERILIISDYQNIREFVYLELKYMNFEVEDVDSGLADELLKNKEYGLLIIDNDLYGYKGTELLKCFRNNGCQTPAVILTNGELRDDVLKTDDNIAGIILKSGDENFIKLLKKTVEGVLK